MKTYPQVFSLMAGAVVLVTGLAFADGELNACTRPACDDESDVVCGPAMAVYRGCTTRAQATPTTVNSAKHAAAPNNGVTAHTGGPPPSSPQTSAPLPASVGGARSALPASITGGTGFGGTGFGAMHGASPRPSGGHSRR
jgi:hypothetical protein